MCDFLSIFTQLTVFFFSPSQPQQWEVQDKDPDNIVQVLKVFQGLLKVFCPTLPKHVISLKKKKKSEI